MCRGYQPMPMEVSELTRSRRRVQGSQLAASRRAIRPKVRSLQRILDIYRVRVAREARNCRCRQVRPAARNIATVQAHLADQHNRDSYVVKSLERSRNWQRTETVQDRGGCAGHLRGDLNSGKDEKRDRWPACSRAKLIRSGGADLKRHSRARLHDHDYQLSCQIDCPAASAFSEKDAIQCVTTGVAREHKSSSSNALHDTESRSIARKPFRGRAADQGAIAILTHVHSPLGSLTSRHIVVKLQKLGVLALGTR